MSTASCPSAGSSCCAYPSSWLSLTANFKRHQRVKERAAELREHAQALAPSRAARGLVARGLQAADLLPAQHGLHIVAQRWQILRAGAPRKPSRIASKNAPSSRNSCARPSRSRSRARSGKTSVVTASATTMPSSTSTTRSSARLQLRAFVVHQHDDGDGDAGQPRTVAQAQQAADDHCHEHGQNVVHQSGCRRAKRRNPTRANQRAKKAVARSSHRGADVRLQHDDRADRAPIAVVQAEAAGQPPAQCRRQRRLCSMNQQSPPLQGEETLRSHSDPRAA